MRRLALLAAVLALMPLTASAYNLVPYFAAGSVDTDGDGVFDLGDNEPGSPNPSQFDADGDQLGDNLDPNSGSNDSDGDLAIDSYDAQPSNNAVTSVAYLLNSLMTVSVGQAFSFAVVPNVPTAFGYDRLTMRVDGTPEAMFFAQPGDTSFTLIGGAYGLSPGTHTVSIESMFSFQLPSGHLQTSTFVTVLPVPEPTSIASLATLALLGRRRRA